MKKMKKNAFIEGTIIAYIAILITKLLGAIYVIPFYKIIGPTGGVLYGYAYNIYNLFLNISTSGIPTAISIIISEYNALKMFDESEFAFKTANKVISIISFIAFLIMFIFAKYLALFFIGDIESVNSLSSVILVIRVISLCLLVVPFLSVTRGYLQGNKYVSISSNSQLIEQIVRIFIALIGSYIAINVLSLSIPIGVSIALFGTVISAFVALLYLKHKIRISRSSTIESYKNVKSKKLEKEIIKKIAYYALPIIIIAITQNLYEMIDLKLILKGLSLIKSNDIEVIASIVVTWAPKICMVINSLAMGLCASIIPYIVEGFVKKDNEQMNNKFNQSINTILFVSIPLSLFIILFKNQIYYLFYGISNYGGIILGVETIVSILFSISMVINMILQGMKKYKLVYISTTLGLTVNALLDIPLILFLYKINIYPYLGTLLATIVGQLVTISIPMYVLRNEHSFKYRNILNTMKGIIFPVICMMFSIIIYKYFVKFNNGYLITLIKVGIIGMISVSIYVLISYKNELLHNVIGEKNVDKLLKKIRFNK